MSYFSKAHKIHHRIGQLLSIFLVFLCYGCVQTNNNSRPNLLIFAASSLTNALEDVKEDFEKEAKVDLTINYAGSSTLARQLLNGAEADLFISANREWANTIEHQKPILKRNEILGNRLVVVTHDESGFKPKRLKDLLDPRINNIAIADPEGVPAGIYAKKILINRGLWHQLRHKFIMGTDVRHTMAHVENGGAEVGFVYATDELISSSTHTSINLTDKTNDDISYPVLLLESEKNKETPLNFYNYLISDRALQTFKRHGFVVKIKS